MQKIVLALIAAFWLSAVCSLTKLERAVVAQTKSQVVLLGTGTPNADPERSGPALAVVVNDTPYLIDAGPGVVRRAAAAHRNGVMGLAVSKLRRLFLTHLHSDHTAGLPDFIFTPAVLERDAPVDIFGPRGTKAMTGHILKAYAEDIRIRLHGGEPSKPAGYVVRAHDVQPGVIYRDGNVTVKAFAVKHGTWPQAFGYRFETPDRVIVISGDCAPSESIVAQCNGCDVLVHEVYAQAGFVKRPAEWRQYHSRFHTSSFELAQLAARAKPGLLILYHQLLWSATKEQLLDEIKQGYNGKVVFGNDLEVY